MSNLKNEFYFDKPAYEQQLHAYLRQPKRDLSQAVAVCGWVSYPDKAHYWRPIQRTGNKE